jgi:hypothetical protein
LGQLALRLSAGKIGQIFPTSPFIRVPMHACVANGACPAPQHIANIKSDGE